MRQRIVKKILLETEKVAGIIEKPVAKAVFATARGAEFAAAGLFEVGSDYLALQKYEKNRAAALERGDAVLKSENIIYNNNISSNIMNQFGTVPANNQVLPNAHGANEALQNDPHVSQSFAEKATYAPFEGRVTGVNSKDMPVLENARTESPVFTTTAQPNLAPLNTGSKIDSGPADTPAQSTSSAGKVGFNLSGGSAAPTSSEKTITIAKYEQVIEGISNKTLAVVGLALVALVLYSK
jgi:hypothetical protein